MGILAMLGGLIALIGYVWLIVVAFQTSGAIWGIVNIFFQPITGLIFCIVRKTGWKQFAIMVLGVIIWAGLGGLSMMGNYPGVR
jgi:hypothetical protein